MMIPERFAVCRGAALAALIASAFLAVTGKRCAAAQSSDGQLTIEVVDSESGQPIAARMHLKNMRGREIGLRLPGTTVIGGHFYIDGSQTLPLRVGQYTFELDAGPEFRTQSGHFEIERHADDSKRIEMKRFANLRDEGWYGGDLDVARRLADLPLILRAEGLAIIPNQRVFAGKPLRTTSRRRAEATVSDASSEQFRAQADMMPGIGGEVLLIDTEPPFESVAEYENLSSMLEGIRQARQQGARIIARTPYAWDLPVWLAGGDLDAIQLIHHHAEYDSVADHENDGRPRDKKLFPGRRGNGRWSEAVYYHVLNCGFRIPPVAGSGSGWNHSPVGTNRVYAYCGEKFSEEAWWESVLAGRVVVSNGPLLRPKVQGRAPGYVFHLDAGSASFEIGLDLATRVPVEYLQIIKNGEVAAEVRLADWTKQQGRLPPVDFDASGWFLVRAVTNNQKNYQFASSGPYYVEKGGESRVSRRSVQFFLDWIEVATARLNSMGNLQPRLLEILLAEQESTRRHFEQLLSEANTD